MIDYSYRLLYSFCCVRARLLRCPRAADMTSVCSCSAVRARSHRPLCVVASASLLGCFSLCARLLRPPRAAALTSVSSCLSGCCGVRVRFALVSARGLLRRPHVVASASTCGCFGVRLWLLRLPRAEAVTSARGADLVTARRCLVLRVRVLGRPRGVIVASNSNVYKA